MMSNDGTASHHPRYNFARWPLLLLAVSSYAWLAIYQPWMGKHDNDFKHMYLGAQALLAGVEPYSYASLRWFAEQAGLGSSPLNPYVYLPFTGYVMSPLTLLSLRRASDAWFCLNHLFLLASLFLLARQFWPKRTSVAVSVMLIAVAPNAALHRTLTAGQLNLALLFMLTWAFVQLMRGRPKRAGAILAFAALFKLFPAIFGSALWLLNQRKALASMVLCGIAALFLTLLLPNSIEHHRHFADVLPQMSFGKSTWQQHGARFWKDPYNQSINSFLTHALVGGGPIKPWVRETQQTANQLTALLAVLIVAGWLATSAKHKRSDVPFAVSAGKQAGYQAALVTGLLVPSLMWDHYLIMLVLPIVVLTNLAARLRRWWAVATLVAIYIWSAIPFPFHLEMFTHGPWLAGMSFKLFPTLLLYGLTLCFSLSTREVFPADVTGTAEHTDRSSTSI